jgi:hypothetical protein
VVISPSELALGADEREAIARGLAASLRGTVEGLAPDESRRWWRLVATETFDAWLIDWPSATSVPRHDHDDAAATIVVIRGDLVELRFEPSGTLRREVVTPARSHHVPVGVAHELTNQGPFPASSIHVYSPPLRTMGFYDHRGMATHRDEIDPSPAMWSLDLP